jgi:branched-chain amino acid transport system substrate-binding protein
MFGIGKADNSPSGTRSRRNLNHSGDVLMKLGKYAKATVLGLGLMGSVAAAAEADTLKIGLIAPLTGGGAPWGKAEEIGVKILANEINAQGGLDVAGKKYTIDVIAYDDEYKAANAVAAYNRLTNQDGVKYMIVLATPSTLALKPNIEGDDVLVVTASGAGKTVSKDDKHLVRMFSTLVDYIPPFYGWLKDNVKQRKICVLDPNDDSGWDTTNLVVKAATDDGFDVVDKEMFDRDQKDFSPLLTRIIGTGAEILDLASTPPATSGLIVRQARESGFKGLIIKSGGPAAKEIVDSAGKDAAEGVYNLLYINTQSDGYKRIAADYQKIVGQVPNELVVSFYDGANVLLHAIQAGGDVNDPAKARAAFAKVLPMQSAQGVPLTYGGLSTSGALNQILTIGFVGQIHDGVPTILGTIHPK